MITIYILFYYLKRLHVLLQALSSASLSLSLACTLSHCCVRNLDSASLTLSEGVKSWRCFHLGSSVVFSRKS